MLPASKLFGFLRPVCCASSKLALSTVPKWVPQHELPERSDDAITRVPRDTDILIIGGGLIGQSIAYFLKATDPHDIRVTLVERDPTYKIASSALSAASIRQQFSLPENIQLSVFTASFLKNAKKHLAVENTESIDVNFNHVPYLFLGETDKHVATLEKNYKIQREHGAAVRLITTKEIKERYPWLNVDQVKLGSLGLDNEGYFDPWLLMTALKRRNIASGVRYVQGEVEGFEFSARADGKVNVNGAVVSDLFPGTKDAGPYSLKFRKAIISSGCWSGQVAAKLGLGAPGAPAECKTPLPVEPRKRMMYVVHAPKGPAHDCPMVCDPHGIHFRREGFGGHILLGGRPLNDEPDISNLEPDTQRFTDVMWPLLAKRAPCFEECKLTHAWAGYYDYNPLDHNLIIGPHTYFRNVVFATGLSGHGVMHCLGVGRAAAELIHYGKYKTIDLTRFGFERVVAKKPIWEETML